MSRIAGIGSNYQSYSLYGKIASGKRIQSAADDAAGSAIASKMEAQQRTQNMMARNRASQVDAINISDGARSGISDYLQEIRSLAVQASNGTNSDSDKQAIQNQIDQLKSGINDIGSMTKYNETYLLGGDDSLVSSLGLTSFNVMNGEIDMSALDQAIESVGKSRSSDGATSNGLSASIEYLANSSMNTMAGLSRIDDLDMGEAVTQQKRDEALQKYAVTIRRRQMDDQQTLMNRMFGG